MSEQKSEGGRELRKTGKHKKGRKEETANKSTDKQWWSRKLSTRQEKKIRENTKEKVKHNKEQQEM